MLDDLGFGGDFLDAVPKEWDIKIMNILNFIRISKHLFCKKYIYVKRKGKQTTKRIFVKDTFDENCYAKCTKPLIIKEF